MSKQQNITVKVADVATISMTIPSETEELIRRAEANVGKLWKAWRQTYNTKSTEEILAMMTFQFARRYYQLLEQAERQQHLLEDFENELDRLLLIGDEEAE